MHLFSPFFRLKWLKRIRKERELELKDGGSNPSLFVHTGFKCDGCGIEPIKGGRFTCLDCENSVEDSIDFCLECAPKEDILELKPWHLSGHRLRPVRKRVSDLPSATADVDYLFQNNYLDPNFVN